MYHPPLAASIRTNLRNGAGALASAHCCANLGTLTIGARATTGSGEIQPAVMAKNIGHVSRSLA